jgi:hypothetical protein
VVESQPERVLEPDSDLPGAAPAETQRDVPRTPLEVRVARHVVAQLADAARLMPNQPVELALNPEELGRVKMTLTTSEGAISVALVAERAETTELLRRNIDALTEDFRNLGYRDISFSFGGGGTRHRQDRTHTDMPAGDPEIPDVTPAIPPVRISLTGAVDLRL